MKEVIRNNFGAIIFSIAVHAMLLGLLFFSFDFQPERKLLTIKPNVIKAVAVDASKVQAELEKLKRADDRNKKKEKDRIANLKREENRLRKKRAAEEKKLAKLKKKRQAEERQRKLEQKNLAELKKQQAALKKKQQAETKKRQAEQRKQAELKKQQAAFKEKRQAELKKKQDAIKKRQALAKKKREADKKQRQKELAQQLAAEEQAREDKLAIREIDKYQVLIRQKVVRNWLKPTGSSKGLVSTVKVRLIPGGDVIDVKVIKSSGNVIYDRSVERAVRKASPLPLPKDPAIAARMYDIEFNFALET